MNEFVQAITANPIYLVGGVAMLLSLGWYGWRRAAAKDAAEAWLRQHHYHVVALHAPWLRMAMFAPRLFRNENNAFDFEATVEDRNLGGEARLFLRVWANWMGELNGEIEVVVDEISRGDAHPLMERLADAQAAILRRVADGETAFYAPRRSEGGQEEFNGLVEHVMALSRRGMITCDTPSIDGRATTNYTSIDNIALTRAGRTWLESQQPHAREGDRGRGHEGEADAGSSDSPVGT